MSALLTLDEIAALSEDLERVPLDFRLHEPLRCLLATARAYWTAHERAHRAEGHPLSGEVYGLREAVDRLEAENARLLTVCSTVEEARLQLETRLKEENARLRAVVEAAKAVRLKRQETETP